ncbi:MAG: putative lipid II flippase FtsW [Candidatus Kerfeldbacteria bacterium]|nr:putative lipid II flippase FtsW [Candidatus Kerfeldbacteria bacterium]
MTRAHLQAPASHEHEPDRKFILLLGLLVAFGFIMLWSASSVIAHEKFGDGLYYVKQQLIFGLGVGSLGLLVAYRLDYHIWRKWAVPMMFATLVLLVLVLIPGVGFEYGGARRWIAIGSFLFQPTEVAKFTFLVYLSAWLEERAGESKDHLREQLVPFLVFLGVLGILVMAQPDLGTMTVITAIALSVYFVSGARFSHFSLIGIGGIALLALLIRIAPYRAARLTVFLNPEVDPQGIGYHVNQALLAVGSGGFFGFGLGRSRQKYNYLPEVTGDSIYAVIAEELGFIFAVGLIILFLFIVRRGLVIARTAPDMFGRYLATGITIWIAFQAFVNIGSMLGVLPLTGITLPFVSYGKSSMVMLLTAIGVLLNISKQTKNHAST